MFFFNGFAFSSKYVCLKHKLSITPVSGKHASVLQIEGVVEHDPEKTKQKALKF